jgi:hypothetical protein
MATRLGQCAAVELVSLSFRVRGQTAASLPWCVRDDDNIVWSPKLPE